MIRYWFIVCSLVIIPLSIASSLAVNSAADVTSGPQESVEAEKSVSSFKTTEQKQEVIAKRTLSNPSDPANRRFRRNVAAVGGNLEVVRNVDDNARRDIANDETKKISERLPPNVDRYNLFPFDYYDIYQRGESDKLELAVRRLEALAVANELRRAAASNNEKRGSLSATSEVDRRHHYDGDSRTETEASDPKSAFDYLSDEETDHDYQDKRSQEIGGESRQHRSFDSLGGGLIPIKRQFDSLGGGIVPITRKSSRESTGLRSKHLERSAVGKTDHVNRWLKSAKRQFDSLGGGMLPIKRRSRSKSVDEGDRSLVDNTSEVRRRNFDTLGGGLLPI